jgi:hypothetical protein
MAQIAVDAVLAVANLDTKDVNFDMIKMEGKVIVDIVTQRFYAVNFCLVRATAEGLRSEFAAISQRFRSDYVVTFQQLYCDSALSSA